MRKNESKTASGGYTLLEIMLVFVVLLASITGVYTMLGPARLKAGVEQEQRHLGRLVDDVRGGFGRTQGSYTGLSNATFFETSPDDVTFETPSMIVSKMGDNILLRPASVEQTADAFDVVYQGLDRKKCLNFVRTFFPQSYTVLVGSSQEQVQDTLGSSEGRLISDALITDACNASEFTQNQGVVVFRFYEPMTASTGALDPACGCTSETQTQDLPCGAGQSGVIQQERSSTCTGGTPSCPLPEWSAWNTTGNTCTGGAVPMSPTLAVAPPLARCTEEREQRVFSCPPGEQGMITEVRESSCATPTSSPVWSPWTLLTNSCSLPSPETATCGVLSADTRNVACPGGQIGSIRQERFTECAGPFATPQYSDWVEVSRDCRIACADAGTCCQPLPDQTRAFSCSAGFYGAGTERRTSWCDALNPDTGFAPFWNPWLFESGTACTKCQDPETITADRWTPQTALCPAAQYGQTFWERQETRSQTTSYNCPAGTVSPPPPTVGPWTSWTATGATRSPSGSCQTCPASTNVTRTQWVFDSQACPLGEVGSHTWEREETRVETTGYDCPAGTVSLPVPNTTWTSWTPTGAIRSEVNTCAPAACVEDGQPYNQWVSVIGVCPAGESGTNSHEKEQARTRSCNAGTWGSWSAWTDTGNTRNPVYTCAPVGCEGSATELQWIPDAAVCDPGYVGTHTWEKEQIRSRVCSAPPSWDPFGSWSDTGNIRNTVNTCVLACVAPQPTTTTLFRGAPWVPLAVREFDALGNAVPTGTGCLRQEHSQREPVTRTTTWSCPGPTSSDEDSYGGPATYELDPLGSWATVSDTCVVPPPTCTTWTGSLLSENEDDGNQHDIFAFSGTINGLAFDFSCDSGGIGVGISVATCDGQVDGTPFLGKYWAATSIAGNPTPRPTVFEMLQSRGGISTLSYDCTGEHWRCAGHNLFTLQSNSGSYMRGDGVSTWIQECTGDCDQFEYTHTTCP